MQTNLESVGGRYIETFIAGDLSNAVSALPPLCTPVPMRFLFVPTSSDWTAFLDNGRLGTYAVGPMKVLAGRIGCQGLAVTSVPHTMPSRVERTTKGRYGANMMEVYGPDGSLVRSISAANDGGKWRFDQSGTPFDFEDTPSYDKRKVADRFTVDHLDDYAKHLGLDPFEERFYMPDASLQAILLARNDSVRPSPDPYAEYSIEAIQEGLGMAH